MAGTMGLGLAAFVPIWTLMMAAMMLPSVSPMASLYARTIHGRRAIRIAGLVVGYLAVWAAAGVPAYGLAWLAGWLTGKHPGAAHVMAVAVFAVCGIYQLSPLKDRCLAHCRSPLGLLLHYGSYPRQVPRPARRRPSRRILPGLLLGPDGDPDRGGRDERRRHGRPGRAGADRENLAMGSRWLGGSPVSPRWPSPSPRSGSRGSRRACTPRRNDELTACFRTRPTGAPRARVA